MTDEEIRLYAKRSLIDACKSTGFYSEEGKFQGLTIEFGDGTAYIELMETLAGDVMGFSCDYESKFGNGNIEYSPQPYIEGFIRQMDAELNDYNYTKKYKSPELLGLIWGKIIRKICKLVIDITPDELANKLHVMPIIFHQMGGLLYRTCLQLIRRFSVILSELHKF